MLELLPQCCDAGQYLDLGRICATTGQCWQEYRPGGTIYWFSIPYRMGWPLSSLVWMNLGVMMLSCLLAPLALLRDWAALSRPAACLRYVMLLIAAILVHGFFFYPVLFNSLADLPGTALVLIGIWLLLLACRHQALTLFAVAGLCLGLGVWLRAYYLYPVSIALASYALCWVFQRQRGWKDAGLLLVLLPVALQFQATHTATGQWGFLDPASTSSWEGVHFSSNFSSYDTILPRSFHYDIPACSKNASLRTHLENKSLAGLACLFGARTYFYLGSYAPKTYLFNKNERHYSWTFLLLNLLAIVLALKTLWQRFGEERLGSVFVFMMAALCYGEAIVLLPEQRFAAFTQVMAWLLMAVYVLENTRRNKTGLERPS